MSLKIKDAENCIANNISKLETLSPLKVLSRGYAAVSKENAVVTGIENIKCGDMLTVSFKDGSLSCNVTEILKENNNV